MYMLTTIGTYQLALLCLTVIIHVWKCLCLQLPHVDYLNMNGEAIFCPLHTDGYCATETVRILMKQTRI